MARDEGEREGRGGRGEGAGEGDQAVGPLHPNNP